VRGENWTGNSRIWGVVLAGEKRPAGRLKHGGKGLASRVTLCSRGTGEGAAGLKDDVAQLRDFGSCSHYDRCHGGRGAFPGLGSLSIPVARGERCGGETCVGPVGERGGAQPEALLTARLAEVAREAESQAFAAALGDEVLAAGARS